MTKLKAILGVCLIFLMGMIAGGALTTKIMEYRFHHFMKGGPPMMGELIVRRLTSDLSLDDAQRLKLEAIVQASQTEIQAVHNKVDPEMTRIMEGSTTQIRAILNPEQVTKFDKISAKGRGRWLGPPPMPPPGGGGPFGFRGPEAGGRPPHDGGPGGGELPSF